VVTVWKPSRPPPRCSLFPPHEQLLVAAVGGGDCGGGHNRVVLLVVVFLSFFAVSVHWGGSFWSWSLSPLPRWLSSLSSSPSSSSSSPLLVSFSPLSLSSPRRFRCFRPSLIGNGGGCWVCGQSGGGCELWWMDMGIGGVPGSYPAPRVSRHPSVVSYAQTRASHPWGGGWRCVACVVGCCRAENTVS
jgi:hypothetical protein